MSRGLGRDHDHVQVGAWLDLLVQHRETVGEGQRGILPDVGFDFLGVQLTVKLIRRQDHDQVGAGHRVSHIGNFQAVRFGLSA